MTENSLHQILLARLEVAKRFTKENIENTKKWIEDYNGETPKPQSIEEIIDRDQRYQYTAKVIFDNVEKYRSSFFEKPPDVLYTKKGKADEEKAQKISSAWEYLKEKTNFKQFMDDSYTHFGIGGFCVGHVGYRKEVETKTDEEGTEYSRFNYDDPILEVGDYENEWFMPDSIFTPDAKQISYFRKKKMSKADVIKAFGVEAKEDESILSEDVTEEKESLKSELLRCGVYYYFGTLPKKALVDYINKLRGDDQDETNPESSQEEASELAGDDGAGESKQTIYAVFTTEKILKIDESPIKEPTCAIGRWYSLPKKFFGFGLAKLLEEQQRQESIRTGQLIRYADVYAFPKLAMDLKDAGNDPKQWMQRSNPVLSYRDKVPSYLTPPSSNGAINAMMNQNQSDIQTNSGLTDISKMQSSQTLQTATGQTQVADSNEKRVKVAKEKYFEFLKQIIIKIFKYAQAEWQDTKIQYITDEQGNTNPIEISKEDFSDIDFDSDISVDFESMLVNKDVVRQQAIVLYDKVKDDPMVDKAKVFKKMLKDGFGEKNPDNFIKESAIQPGMQFTGQDGQMYIADESGSLVLQEAMDQTQPTDGNLEPASDQMAVQSNPMLQAGANV